MAKRLSSGQTNTLFNYFQSPKMKKKPEKTDVQSEKEEPEEVKEYPGKDESDDEQISRPKKRMKLAIIDSDSEEDNNVSSNGTTPPDSQESKGSNSSLQHRYAFDKYARIDNRDKENGHPCSSSSKKPASSSSPMKKDISAPPVNQDIHTNWLHNRLPFLQPDKIRDIHRKRPDDPDYDPRTLLVPRDFLNNQTPAMRQWWVLKSRHMDSVLFFKVGKFYELYHMDAVVGVTQLGFSYMKGEFAHSGFPEIAYHKMAHSLMEKGFKVARTEQTETPEMMAERCRKQGRATKFDKVVNREVCQVSTKATCVYNAQLPEAMDPLPCYLFAISEEDTTFKSIKFGVCFVDTSIGIFHLSEFEDDKHCSRLLSVLAENPPGLILVEKRRQSPKLKEVLNTYYKDIRKDALASHSQFYGAYDTVEKLLNGSYFLDEEDNVTLPKTLQDMIDGYFPKPEYELCLRSLGACMWYLEDSKLDIQVISIGKFEKTDPENLINKEAPAVRHNMILDSTTITNLHLLGRDGSLQRTIDYCETAFGKRLLQQWICKPLCDITKIRERQEAIKELREKYDLLTATMDILKKLPDLERQVAKIHIYGNKVLAKNHPDSRAVFYEANTYSKRRIGDLLKTLRAFERAQEIASLFKDCESSILRRITQFEPDGMYVDLTEPLNFFKGAFDQQQAETEGKIIPRPGVEKAFDEAEQAIEDIKNKLNSYLVEQQKFFGCKVTYFGSDKKRFQIDVPDSHNKKVTSEYQLEGTKKGSKSSKRYSTPYSRQLLAEMLRAESERSKVIQDLNRRIFQKFSLKQDLWDQAIRCLGILDVLCSFGEYAKTFGNDLCLPEVEPISDSHKILIEEGRHPCINFGYNLVSNDTIMGMKDYASVLLLTGPNMGGKSTLMRQVAVLCIMAQMGCYVPADRCQLNLIDRIFTRIGAHDDIVQGQSTFLVELSEASSILKHATPHSLVLLDELGRGTSTHDGNAIAMAYVRKLTEINCRTLFSTHYHSLVDHFIDRDDVQLGHMACKVENDEDPTEESVTFLYKMMKGRCPKSYGFNVARLAGLKHSIVVRGREISKQLEEETKNRHAFRNIFSTDIATLRNMIASLNI